MSIMSCPISTGPSYVPSPSRLTLFESTVYFTDGTKEGVLAIDKFKGSNSSQLLYHNRSETREPRGIKAVHPLLQPNIPSPCGDNNGGCEHLCILTEQNGELGFECACNLGWQLGEDRKQCNRKQIFPVLYFFSSLKQYQQTVWHVCLGYASDLLA